jgi:hypothetical protein
MSAKNTGTPVRSPHSAAATAGGGTSEEVVTLALVGLAVLSRKPPG